MSFTRQKQVELDGATASISPLTMVQADEFFDRQETILKSEEFKALDARGQDRLLNTKLWLPSIVQAMNNATPDLKMTVERLRAEFDPVLTKKLKDEMLAMTGIELRPVGETKAS